MGCAGAERATMPAMSESSFSPLSTLKSAAGRALELALNQALALDNETRAELTALSGRSVTLTLESPPLALRLSVDGERLRVGPAGETEPDLAIRSTLSGALSQLGRIAGVAPRDEADSLGQVKVAGDAGLARQLQRLAGRFDPDWQRPLVAVFGEVIGVKMGDAISFAFKQARSTGQMLTESSRDWLTEEARLVVSRAELDAFHADIDALSNEAAQLSARIARLDAARATD